MTSERKARTQRKRSMAWLLLLSAMVLLSSAIALTAIGAVAASRLHVEVTTADMIEWILPPPLKFWRRLSHRDGWPPGWFREPGQGGIPKAEPDDLAPSSEMPFPALLAQPDLVADVAEGVLPSVVNISTSRVVRGTGGTQMMPFSSDPMLQWFFRHGAIPRQAPRERLQRSLGSGVIVSKEGLILTNQHVVEQADVIRVILHDGTDLNATVVGSDSHTDLAVLRLTGDEAPALSPLSLGRSEDLRLGQIVLAVGNPFGLSGTVTMGIVSAKGRTGMGITDYEDFIQTDAAINPGNSGGALVSLDGELVGINTAIVSRSGGSQGIGFAIPSDMARAIMAELVERGEVEWGWLGVYIQDLEPDLAEAMDIDGRRGALVAQVPADSPADRAGIQPGDVVVSLDDEVIQGADRLRTAVALHAPGTHVEVGIVRDGELRVVEVELGDLERSKANSEVEIEPDGPLAGLSVQTLDASNRREHGLPDSVTRGLLITALEEGSPAWLAGLRVGDVLLESNKEPLEEPGDLRQIEAGGGSHLLLLVAREGTTLFVAVPLG
jgi:Do/DeqQ family serine protease